MTSANAFQYDMWFERASSLVADWKEHKAGNLEVRETYPLEYIGANLVEQVGRIWRLQLSDERVEELNKNFLPCLEEWRGSLVEESLKGAEVIPLIALLDNVVDSIDFSLKVDEEPELDFDLKDLITDCLVKRDGLHLILEFTKREIEQLEETVKAHINALLQDSLTQISEVDRRIRENLDVFALASDFCLNYTKVNNVSDQELYWWLFEPINRATDANIVSLLSLKSRFLKPTDDQQIKDLSTFLNAEVQKNTLECDDDSVKQKEEPPPDEGLRLISTREAGEPTHVKEKPSDYALAASSRTERDLEPGMYTLVVNLETSSVEHHRVIGLVGSSQRLSKYYTDEVTKIVDYLVPKTAEGIFGVSARPFSIDLDETTQKCGGESLGLAVLLEYLCRVGFLPIDKPIAATGELELRGDIRGVSDINPKLKHAIEAGFPIVLVPKENEDELDEETRSSKSVKLVSSVKEAKSSIEITGASIDDNADKGINQLNTFRVKCLDEGFSVSDVKHEKYNYNIEVSGLGGKAKAIVDFNSKGIYKPLRIQGKSNSPLFSKLNQLLFADNVALDLKAEVAVHLRAKVTILKDADRSKIQDFLENNFTDHLQAITESGCDYRYDITRGAKVVIKQYKNGTLFLDGTSGDLWNEIVDAIFAVSQIRVSVIEERKTANLLGAVLPAGVTTWIGVDEAGKGDYFGPLVTASVLVDHTNIEQLSKLGIRDSKSLSDARNIEVGDRIRSLCGDKCYVLVTMPEKYNELMGEPSFKKDAQRLLAWQHRRAIENILLKYECKYAICDQFGHENLIKEGLKTGKGTQIEIIQRPKAESNLAVAAASVLARREFLLRLQKMSSDYGVSFPKGASDFEKILLTASTLVKRKGTEILGKIAKVHFKTTGKIMERLS